MSCENTNLTDTYLVKLGDTVTLNCTYNCSNGFVRGCWKAGNSSDCMPKTLHREQSCTVSYYLQNVSSQDLKYYYCKTEVMDDTKLQQKTERVVLLKLKDETCCGRQAVTYKTTTTNLFLSAGSEDPSAGDRDNDRIKILAAVILPVALVLAALAVYLCFIQRRQHCNEHPPDNMLSAQQRASKIIPQNKGPNSTPSERVILRIPTPENESDPEVPYADIVINIRGASTPDLSQALYLNSADHSEWWGGNPRSHLQAARSADMLHVPHLREVSRKMSTNSEYAVITYA